MALAREDHRRRREESLRDDIRPRIDRGRARDHQRADAAVHGEQFEPDMPTQRPTHDMNLG